jgi:peptide/nickel transport system substrate-binding protein
VASKCTGASGAGRTRHAQDPAARRRCQFEDRFRNEGHRQAGPRWHGDRRRGRASPNFIFPYPPSTNTNGYNISLTFGLWPDLAYPGDGGKSIVNRKKSLFSSFTYSHRDSVITIVLKPWEWSDGVPITSRDFTFTYNLLKVNYNNWIGYVPGLFPTDVKKVLTPNQHTVVLDLAQSYNPAFYTDDVLSQIALMPQHAWDKTSARGKVGNYDETKTGAKAVYAFLQKQGGRVSG